jgi:hypothetical protein
MKKLLPILLLFGTSSVYAGAMTTRHQTSLQSVQTPTITTTQRTGNSYSVSGNNVNTSYTYCSADCSGNSPTNTTVTGGVARISYTSTGATTMTDISASQGVVNTGTTNDPVYQSTGTFSFANSYTQGDATDATGTNKTVTAGATGANAVPGTVTSAHTVTLAGGQTSGTTVTGQFISEISVFN